MYFLQSFFSRITKSVRSLIHYIQRLKLHKIDRSDCHLFVNSFTELKEDVWCYHMSEVEQKGTITRHEKFQSVFYKYMCHGENTMDNQQHLSAT